MTSFEDYIDRYGGHFNKKLYEWALSLMDSRNGEQIKPITKEQMAERLRSNGIELDNEKGYDAAYVYAMAQADYFGSSISDDMHLLLYVKDFLDDPDGYDTKAFDHFVMDCRAKGEYIFFDDML